MCIVDLSIHDEPPVTLSSNHIRPNPMFPYKRIRYYFDPAEEAVVNGGFDLNPLYLMYSGTCCTKCHALISKNLADTFV